MHLSDFTFLERCWIYVYAMAYFIFSIYQGDRFKCLSPKKIFSGEMKSICTVLMFLMMTAQVSWDAIFTYVKYKEGYVLDGAVGVQKPFLAYSPSNQNLSSIAAYIQSGAYSIESCLYFMLQCFWNYLSNAVAKKSFMSSFEFMSYIVWAIITLALFPILEWYYHFNPKIEFILGIPYGGQVFITALLGIRTHRRFARLVRNAKQTGANKTVISKLTYFKDVNFLMMVCQFSYSSSFFVFCIDGMLDGPIAQNKFASDVILVNVNITALSLYVLFIAIFHPLKTFLGGYAVNETGTSGGVKSGDMRSNTNAYMNSHTQPPMEFKNTGASPYKRFSQRVTSFIGDRFQNGNRMMDVPTNSFQQTFDQTQPRPSRSPFPTNPSKPSASQTLRHESKTFLRPMSPVSVDYPPSQSDTVPLTRAVANQQSDISMDDFVSRHHQRSPPPFQQRQDPPQPRRVQYQSNLYGSYYDESADTLPVAISPSPSDMMTPQNDWLRSSPSRRQPRF
ncbi:hypothetical protein DM01DRAFT_1403121 [Hesseltinella vesiculosa]|uniref:Uncharacterized protein n=1 Tax=Hesseltinella vesiculosa TaxID=101127 RepID=A0A1X2GX42_9FUNG|nr:hypothetical protein DM01DRAFT_1403121 [Hesseltinella vesiculosa]